MIPSDRLESLQTAELMNNSDLGTVWSDLISARWEVPVVALKILMLAEQTNMYLQQSISPPKKSAPFQDSEFSSLNIIGQPREVMRNKQTNETNKKISSLDRKKTIVYMTK